MTQAAILAASGSLGTTTGFKNRLINGNMMIDQRNNGGSVTPNGYTYQLDRWTYGSNLNGKVSIQQVSDAPAGFFKSVLITSLSAYSVGSSDRFIYSQAIEGVNTSDIAWGTANGLTCTLSFWVKSSLTGTFTCSFNNETGSYSYVTTYTISAANTWQKVTLTIPPATAGVWNTGTTSGSIFVVFGLGSGSTFQTSTLNTWQNAFYESATGRTALVATNGATWNLTGVQFEVGTTATNFDFRSFGTELQLCQRYYESTADIGTVITSQGSTYRSCTTVYAGSNYFGPVVFKVTKRAIPTITFYYSTSSGSLSGYTTGGASTVSANSQNESEYGCNGVVPSVTNLSFVQGNWVAVAEL